MLSQTQCMREREREKVLNQTEIIYNIGLHMMVMNGRRKVNKIRSSIDHICYKIDQSFWATIKSCEDHHNNHHHSSLDVIFFRFTDRCIDDNIYRCSQSLHVYTLMNTRDRLIIIIINPLAKNEY